MMKNGVNTDALEKLYFESPEIFDNLEDLYRALGIINDNLVVNDERISEIWAYNSDVIKNLYELTTAIQKLKDDALIEANIDRIGEVDSGTFSTDEEYYKYMITTYDELRNEAPVLANAFLENNLPNGEEMTYWLNKLSEEIGVRAALDFMEGLNDEHTAEYHPDHTWDPDQTNVGYGTIAIDGEDYAIIPLGYGDDYEVVETIHCNDIEFDSASFVWNWSSGLDSEARGIYNIVQVIYQGLKATGSIQVDLDIVENAGEQRVVIRYYDPLWTRLDLETGERIREQIDEGYFDITLSEDHIGMEYGYIFCSGGKTYVMPLIYPDDRVMVNGVDITNKMRVPVEISDELVRRIEEALASQGIYIDLP